MSIATATFYFDGDCGFCQWAAEKLQKLTTDGLDIAPAYPVADPRTPATVAEHIETHAVYQRSVVKAFSTGSGTAAANSEGAAASLTGANNFETDATAAQLASGQVNPGHLSSGSNGGAGAAADLFLGHKGIGHCLIDYGANPCVRAAGRVLVVPLLSPLFARMYRLVALNRHRLGPLVGAQACRLS